MKNTTFRKKALLSSVAMLLVALVALGSATFAWFAANPNASATGISLKTTASTGLVIKTDSDQDDWTHNATLYTGIDEPFNLDPVSQEQNGEGNDTSAFWTVEAAGPEDEAAGGADKPMTKANAGTYEQPGAGSYYKENVYFRLTDGSADENSKYVTITGIDVDGVANSMSGCVRVSVVYDGKIVCTYAPDGNMPQGTLTTTAKSAGSFNPALTTTFTTEGVKVFTGLTAADDMDDYVTVYVWLDGQDENCYSDKVGNGVNITEMVTGVTVDFTLK